MTQKVVKNNKAVVRLFKYGFWGWFGGLCLCAGFCIGSGSWELFYMFNAIYGMIFIFVGLIVLQIVFSFFTDWEWELNGRPDPAEMDDEVYYTYADFDVDSDSEKKD